MGQLNVKDAGAQKKIQKLHVRQAGADKVIKHIYVWVVDTANSTETNTVYKWEYITSYVPPEGAVPTVSLSYYGGQVETGPQDYQCSWGVVTNKDLPEYHYKVNVEWWVNNSLNVTSQVHQSNGSVIRTYDAMDSVYCVVYYRNDAGTGPTTTTSTL